MTKNGFEVGIPGHPDTIRWVKIVGANCHIVVLYMKTMWQNKINIWYYGFRRTQNVIPERYTENGVSFNQTGEKPKVYRNEKNLIKT